jgi:hypothetical protein
MIVSMSGLFEWYTSGKANGDCGAVLTALQAE